MNLRTLVLRYAIFAVIATVANLATQRLVLSMKPGDHLVFALAMASGTAVGLVTKYILDKRWIFFDREGGAKNHGRKLTLYTAMGVVTTLVFWGTETAFWLVWGTQAMREIGALLGLSLGYVIKYNLDRRFVFVEQHAAASP